MSGSPSVNPNFYNANQVYLWYCTSDTYSGNRDRSNATNGWIFAGKRVIESLIFHLVQYQKPSLATANQILLTGFSAGGMGTSYNADFVGTLLRIHVPAARYRAYVDSGFVTDLPDYNSGFSGQRVAFASMISNWKLVLDEDCEAFYGKIGQTWRCMMGDYLFPFLSTPTFYAQHQYDSPFLHSAPNPPGNATVAEFVEVCKNKLLTDQAVISGLFNPSCYLHGVEAYDNRWNVIEVDGVTPAGAVWEWFQGNLSRPVRYVETCYGFACTKTCPADFI